MSNEKKFVPIRVASSITGFSDQTLRKLHDSNVLEGYKTPSNQRMYSIDSINRFCKTSATTEKEEDRVNILYARVSTKKQKDDLDRQIDFLRQHKREGVEYLLIADIGSGINFNRKGINTILELCVQGAIGEVIIAHKDRLSRFGFDLFNSIIKKAKGTITVIDSDTNKSTEQELAEDLLSIVHIYSCRQMGKRSYSTKKRDSAKVTDDILCSDKGTEKNIG